SRVRRGPRGPCPHGDSGGQRPCRTPRGARHRASHQPWSISFQAVAPRTDAGPTGSERRTEACSEHEDRVDHGGRPGPPRRGDPPSIRDRAQPSKPRRDSWKGPANTTAVPHMVSPRNLPRHHTTRPRWGMTDKDISMSTRVEVTKKYAQAYHDAAKKQKGLIL